MPARPLVALVGLPCAAAVALAPVVPPQVPAPPVPASSVVRSAAPAGVPTPHTPPRPTPAATAPTAAVPAVQARAGAVVDAALVVPTARRALLDGVDAVLVTDPAAGRSATATQEVAEAARRAGRPLRTAAAPASGLTGLVRAVATAGAAPASGSLAVWLPGPGDLRCGPAGGRPGPQEQRAAAALVAAGVRVVAVTSGAGTACASVADHVAQATGGVTVPAGSTAGLTEALSAATVRVSAAPVCEAGLTATAVPDRTTALSGTPATGRWRVRVEPGASAGARLSCVVVPLVDAAPALDAVHALTVRVTAGAPVGSAATAPAPVTAGQDAATRLSATGEDLLALRQAQAELSAAVEHLAAAGTGPGDRDPRLAPLKAVLRTLQERAAVLDARYVALADRADVEDPVPDAPRTELPVPRGPDRPVPPPGPRGTALAAGAAARAVAHALAQRGDPYLWGATGPDAFDCSGLTSSAYAAAGVGIPRVSRQQFWAGVPVARDALLPGDLVFFAWDAGDPRTVHHVGMALGGGLMVHAPKSGDVVRVAPIWSRGYAGAVRIVDAIATADHAPVVLPPVPAPGSTTPGGAPAVPAAPASPSARPSTGAPPAPSVGPSPSPRPAAPAPMPTRSPARPSAGPPAGQPTSEQPTSPAAGPPTPVPGEPGRGEPDGRDRGDGPAPSPAPPPAPSAPTAPVPPPVVQPPVAVPPLPAPPVARAPVPPPAVVAVPPTVPPQVLPLPGPPPVVRVPVLPRGVRPG